MPLKLTDLQEEKARLIKARDHIERELMAIQTLLEGRRLREPNAGDATVDISRLSVEKSVSHIHQEYPDRHISGGEMTEMIVTCDPKKNTKSLRASVGNSQRKLFNDGLLERENSGNESQPRYSYRWGGEGDERVARSLSCVTGAEV